MHYIQFQYKPITGEVGVRGEVKDDIKVTVVYLEVSYYSYF